MAVYAYTETPHSLLRSIKEAIEQEKIETWSCDSDGDFTHTPPQWKRRAWLRPTVEEGQRIVFNIIPPKNRRISRLIYGVYHGRFIEMLLTHFDDRIHQACASAMPAAGDRIGSRAEAE
jgi:hypothetical protein